MKRQLRNLISTSLYSILIFFVCNACQQAAPLTSRVKSKSSGQTNQQQQQVNYDDLVPTRTQTQTNTNTNTNTNTDTNTNTTTTTTPQCQAVQTKVQSFMQACSGVIYENSDELNPSCVSSLDSLNNPDCSTLVTRYNTTIRNCGQDLQTYYNFLPSGCKSVLQSL